MTRLVLAVCGKSKPGGWDLIRYAYEDDLREGERVKDAEYVRQLVSRLSAGADSGNADKKLGATWIIDSKPPAELTRFFDVYVDVSNLGRMNAEYKADYHRYPGCPSQVVADSMEIYRIVRKDGIRPAMKRELDRRKRIVRDRKMSERLELTRARFVDGATYFSTVKDSLGHLERVYIVFSDDWRGRVRRYENGDEYINRKGVIFRAKDNV